MLHFAFTGRALLADEMGPGKTVPAIARAWRKHQTRAVTVLNLVTEQSIEHGMLETLALKQGLSDGVLGRATVAALNALQNAGLIQRSERAIRPLTGPASSTAPALSP